MVGSTNIFKILFFYEIRNNIICNEQKFRSP